MNDQRLERMTRNARNLGAGNHLREELTIERAGEIMWTYSSPELYELLVLTRGWPLELYGAFVAEAMIAAPSGPSQPSIPPLADGEGRRQVPAGCSRRARPRARRSPSRSR
jgi:hypothetical protein